MKRRPSSCRIRFFARPAGTLLLAALSITLGVSVAQAGGRVDVTDLPDEPTGSGTVGRKSAQKYMGRVPSGTPAGAPSSTGETHYLAIHVGGFLSDTEYKWGAKDADTNVGKLTLGVTYRIGEWQNSMDLDARVDYQTFNLQDGSASKLSFLPVIVFPDASSKFPLYFGLGAGLGVFTKQLPGESSISFDYQLLLGARFFNIRGTNAGFFVEGGLKNHVLLLTDGQFNGTFLAVGGVFTF